MRLDRRPHGIGDEKRIDRGLELRGPATDGDADAGGDHSPNAPRTAGAPGGTGLAAAARAHNGRARGGGNGRSPEDPPRRKLE